MFFIPHNILKLSQLIPGIHFSGVFLKSLNNSTIFIESDSIVGTVLSAEGNRVKRYILYT